MERLYCAISIILILCANKIYGGSMLGKGEISLQKSEPCPDAPDDIVFTFSGRPLNRTTYGITMNFSTLYDFDDNVGIDISASRKVDNDYKPGAFVNKDPNACTSMEKLMGEEWFDEFTSAFGIEGCPIPAGNYLAKDYVVDQEKATNGFLFGEYMADTKFFYKNELKGCTMVYVELAAADKLA